MLRDQSQNVRPVNELHRLAGRIGVTCRVDAGGGDQDALRGAGIRDRAMKPLHCPHVEALCLPGGVNDDVAAQDRSGVKNEAVDDSARGGTDVFDVQTHLGQQLVNQVLKLPVSCLWHE